jgi:hypothetical protein
MLAVKSLVKKFLRAVKDEKDSKLVFDQLDSALDQSTREKWSEQEDLAITLRGDYLKIYEVQVDKSESNLGVVMLVLNHFRWSSCKWHTHHSQDPIRSKECFMATTWIECGTETVCNLFSLFYIC